MSMFVESRPESASPEHQSRQTNYYREGNKSKQSQQTRLKKSQEEKIRAEKNQLYAHGMIS